jgi:hypothetical protein
VEEKDAMVDFDKFNNVRGGGWFIVHFIIPPVFKATPHFATLGWDWCNSCGEHLRTGIECLH